MPETDRVLIDPTPEQLTAALAAAASEANADGRVRRLDWPPPGLADFLERWRAEREGQQQWNGGLPRARGGDTRTAVAAAWWTDHGGRKHVRVAGRRGPFSTNQLANVLCPADDRPLPWVVRPDNLTFREEGGRGVLWATCRCGAAGPPVSLGWMGETCGPCHDRLEAGVTPPGHDDPRRSLLAVGEKGLGGLAFLDNNRVAAFGASPRQVRAWDLVSGTARVLFSNWRDAPAGLAVAPDGRTIAVNLWYRRVVLVDVEGGATLAEWEVPSVEDLAFRPDGAVLAVRAREEIILYDVAARAELRRWGGLQRPPFTGGRLAWSPDGRLLAASSTEPAVRVLEAGTGVAVGPDLGRWGGLGGAPQVLAFAPDGAALAGVAEYAGGSLRVCGWPSGEVRADLQSVGAALAFAPDGRVLATAGWDGTLRLWNVADMRPLGTYVWHAGKINGVAFAPDGRRVATAGSDGFVKLWPVAALLGG